MPVVFDPANEFRYNGLDAAHTLALRDRQKAALSPRGQELYRYRMALNTVALDMLLRGMAVDQTAVRTELKALDGDKRDAERLISDVAKANGLAFSEQKATHCLDTVSGRHKWPRGVAPDGQTCGACGAKRVRARRPNVDSVADMNLVLNRPAGMSLDKTVIDRLAFANPVAAAIKSFRKASKLSSNIRYAVDTDGRIHCEFSVAAQDGARWSGGENPWGTGLSLQTLPDRTRRLLIADASMMLVYIDLKQAESNCVAHLAGDEGYIAAHKVGDTHAFVSSRIYPGRDPKELANIPGINPEWTLRDVCKRCQHGCNYGLQPEGISRHTGLSLDASTAFWITYHNSFPGIQQYHNWVRGRVKFGLLTSAFGWERHVLDRKWDGGTFRAALAYFPQNLTAELMSLGILRAWQNRLAHLFAHGHDSCLAQVRDGDWDAVRALREALTVLALVTDIQGVQRLMTIGTDVMVGYNFGKRMVNKKTGVVINPRGLAEPPVGVL